MRRLRRWGTVVVTALLATFAVAGSAAYGSSRAPAKAPAASHGGKSLTDLLGAGLFGSWTGFDPVVTTSISGFFTTVFGTLFDVGPHGTLVPDLATSYKLTNGGQTLTIHLRPGLTFSNGDPLDSSVVAFNMKRSIDPSAGPNAFANIQNWPMTSVATPDATTVVVQFSHVFAGVLASIPVNLDPVALQKMGETAYNLNPIGAGPFMVQTDKPSAQLVLKKNPHYWKKGHPYLDTINVEVVGSDESAYEALQAGQANIAGIATLGLVNQAAKSRQLKEYAIPATGTWALQLNTLKPPFNNPAARQAIYYATNAAAINKHVFNDKYSVMESPTGPGGLFYQPKVPGYRTFNLAKAKSLVHQLGGLNVTLTGASTPLIQLVNTALQSQWKQAGITTTLQPEALATQLRQWKSGDWNIMIINAGSYDPATGFGLPLWFGRTTPFKGVTDPTLQSMMDKAQGTFNKTTRAAEYKQIFKYISDNAYMPYLFSVPTWDVTTNNVTGMGSVTQTGFINWANVGMK
ncbi:MAG: ABC transporter substrate-binding protein [Acidimicrobiaceae bacterium]|nr:ABC transporter substrate-binding protein [Acidimicrobiaceae bacterium]